jgi:uncharacterized protein (TIGR02246 family)
MTAASRVPAVLRATVDAVLADWAWHLDHGEYDEVAELFTQDALFITGGLELRGRAAIKARYTERTGTRSTRHTYSGLRVSRDGPGQLRALSTWVNYAVNGRVPVDDVGVYLVADFDDVLTWSASGDQWLIAERRIIPVFRDPSRKPVGA